MKITYIEEKLLNVNAADTSINKDDEKNLNLFLDALGKDRFSQFHPAGVLILLVHSSDPDQWNIIFTKRAMHLKHHPGEISFPGGRFEQNDGELVNTATRETYEEIGISPNEITILGKLPRQKTISGYLVTPFVGYVKGDYELQIDDNEVDAVFVVPLNFLLEPDNHQKIKRLIAESTFDFYQIQYNEHKIWGATARMLVNLSRFLLPKTKGSL